MAALLARTQVRVDPRRFVIAGVPVALGASLRLVLAEMPAPYFVQVFPNEQTVVLPEDEWARMRGRFPGTREVSGYRLITLEVELDWQVTGYLAAITAALASARIPVGVLSSFHYDHLLVRHTDLDATTATLRDLFSRITPPT